MTQYDQTHFFSKYLDTHLMFPILQFLREQTNLYPKEEITQLEQVLASKTFLFDKQAEKSEEKQKQAENKLSEHERHCEALLKLLKDETIVNDLKEKKQFTIENIIEQHKEVKPNQVDVLFLYAKTLYEFGRYDEAAAILPHFRELSKDEAKQMNAQWGKLACDILRKDWNSALNELNALKQSIENSKAEPIVQLQRRSWLVNWSLFIFFNIPNGTSSMIDFFFEQEYFNAIQNNVPHILRYLAAALIINKKKQNKLNDFVKILEQKNAEYTDPVIKFIEALYVDVDFEESETLLEQCDQVASNDYFLFTIRNELKEASKKNIIETFCRIHSSIDLNVIAQKLQMKVEEAEQWMVNLIKETGLPAKIDTETSRIIIDAQPPNVYKFVTEKTAGIELRTQQILSQLESE